MFLFHKKNLDVVSLTKILLAVSITALASSCGSQRLNFRSDPIAMRRTIEAANATVAGCIITADPDRINAGDAPKVRIGLANGKAIKTLAINGDAMDPAAQVHSLAAIKAYGQMKVIAVATDTNPPVQLTEVTVPRVASVLHAGTPAVTIKCCPVLPIANLDSTLVALA
jgi:hypothetical protein